MVKIRLARVGKKKKPTYRFVVSESTKDTYGKALEILGNYDPSSKVCSVNKDRILYWIGVGAQLSPTVHNMLVDQNVITKEKVKASKGKKKGKAAEAEAAAKAAEQAAAAPAPQAETVAEAPAEAVAEEKPAETPVEEKPAEPAA